MTGQASTSGHMTDQPIFHIALPTDWAAAFADGDYRMSTRGMTLDDVGFIHCSTRQQIEATANRFYGDIDQLVLLVIDPVAVPSDILWEPPTPDVEELFPHIYGPLPIAAVNAARFWMRETPTWSVPDLDGTSN